MSKIKRQSLLIGSIVFLAFFALVLTYWSGVSKGVVPSPITPVIARPTESPVEPTNIVHKLSALPAPASEHVESTATPSREEAPLPETVPTPVPANPAASTPVSAPKPAATESAAAEPVGESGRAAAAAGPGAADRSLAQLWLAQSDKRPAVRVHYNPRDILQLSSLGRGLIVAAVSGNAGQRALYLKSGTESAPLFAPYTETVAERFSDYSLILSASPEFAAIEAALRAYVAERSVPLAFVPDQRFAIALFAEVARANRLRGGHAERPIFEGQLTVDNGQPQFTAFQTRTDAN
jgi:hypothetical protein